MPSLFDRLFISPRYKSIVERDHARLLASIALLMITLLGVFEIQSLLRGGTSFTTAAVNGNGFALLYVVGVYGGGIVTLLATRNGWTTISEFGPLVIWIVSGMAAAIRNGFTGTTDLVSLFILIVIGFTTMRERGVVISFLVGIVLFIIGLGQRPFLATPPTGDSFSTFVGVAILMFGTSAILWMSLRNQSIARQETRAEAESDRLRLATITTEIARRISSQTALDELLTSTVEEIRTRYVDIYHAQIFLIDEFGTMAKLVASTGDVGKLLLSRSHQLEVGSISVIGQVTVGGKSVVARAGTAGAGETVHRRNELLPDTVVEGAFPLLVSGRTIGALDMQSRNIGAFTPEDLPIFQSLADNIAVAIENARLFEQTQARLVENQRLLDQMRGAMREIERLNREMTGQSWSEYITGYAANISSLDVNFKTNTIERNGEWTPSLRQAISGDQTVQEQRGDFSVIAVPIRVRGQVIGAMEFEIDDAVELAELAGLAQTVGERFGLALENTRLYEETQRSAHREQRVNSIAAQYQTVTTVDELLRITISELGDLLGADKASIRLGGIGMGGQSGTVTNGNGAGKAAGNRGGD